jgi:small-conductance mechanosensitive channel
MSTLELLLKIQDSALAHAVSKSDHLVGAGLQIFHVLGFVLLLASLLLINLRLVGLAFERHSLPLLAKEPLRLIWLGLAVAVLSGVLMFVASPTLYFYKPVFLFKIVLLALAVLLQVLLYNRIVAREFPNPLLARATVVLSMVLWFGVGLAGRAIGFV